MVGAQKLKEHLLKLVNRVPAGGLCGCQKFSFQTHISFLTLGKIYDDDDDDDDMVRKTGTRARK